MKNAVIVDAVRTPFGKRDGSFRDTHPQDLAAEPLKALRERNGFDPETIEDVIYGCVSPVDEQGLNVGRLAPMVAGWGDIVPGVQLNRMCGSGQQATNFAAANVMADQRRPHRGRRRAHDSRSDGIRRELGQPHGHVLRAFRRTDESGRGCRTHRRRVGPLPNGTRRIAVDSQQRWKRAWDEGRYDDQVIPVETELDGDDVVVEQDEHPRPGTDLETLSNLPLSFREGRDGFHHPGTPPESSMDRPPCSLRARKPLRNTAGTRWPVFGRRRSSALIR